MDRAIRPVLESLEDRRLLSGVAGAASVAAGSIYTLHLDSAGLPSTTQWAVDWNDGANSVSTAGATSITHTYAGPGVYRPNAHVVGSAAAVPLGLDPSFGTAGKVVDPFGETSDRASAVLVQPNGKVLVAGSTHGTTDRQALARYNADGSLDTSFGTAGHVATAYSADNADQVYAVALQSDGNILAAGTSYGGGQLALFRYTAAGVLDTTFGAGGKVLTNLGDVGAGANAIVVQADGKIVVAGGVASAASGNSVGLVRYNADGSLDTTFGSNGVVLTGFQGSYDFATSLAIQPLDGKLVVGGWELYPGGWNFGLLRLTASGSLDTTFGSPDGGGTGGHTGSLWTELAYSNGNYNNDMANALVIQPDGKIVAAGGSTVWTSAGNRDRFALVRYTASGDLDTSFGAGGIITTMLGDGDARVDGLVLTADGKLVAGGYATVSGRNVFALARYNVNGSLDASFGSGGSILTSFGSGTTAADASILGLAQTADGRLIAAGWATDSTGAQRFATAAFLPSPTVSVSGSLAAPTGLAATAHTGGGVDLAWTAVSSATGYTVSRSTNPDFSAGVAMLATGVTATSYTDTTADSGTTYYYWASAQSGAGSSAPSLPASITTAGLPHDTLLDGSFEDPRQIDGGYTYYPTGSPWTYTGRGGVDSRVPGNGVPVPDGRQEIFLTNDASVSQDVLLSGGQYTISYNAAQGDDAPAGTGEGAELLVDGTVVDSFVPSGHPYEHRQTAGLTLAAGTHTIVLRDVNARMYYQLWVDDVQISFQPTVPVPASDAIHAGDEAVITRTFIDSPVSTGHTATIDWGDGSTSAGAVLEYGGSGSIFATHVYPHAGFFIATTTLRRGSAVLNQSTQDFTVANSAPTIAAIGNQTVKDGDAVSVAAPFADADPNDTHTATINWGDGTIEPIDIDEAQGSGEVIASHVYGHRGVFNATVTVTDASGASAVATVSYTVENVPPTVDVGLPVQRVDAGSPIDLSGYLTDPGDNQTYTYAWVILDASDQTVASGTGPTLTYTPPAVGRFRAILTVTDGGGLVGTGTTTIVAQDPAAPPDTSVPDAPSGVSLGTVSPDGITFTWQNNATDADGVEIEWSSDGGEYYVIDVVGPDATTYTDAYPDFNVNNYYRVVSYRGDIESDPSDPVSGEPVTAPTPFDNEDAGANERDTLSPYSVVHDQPLTVPAVAGLLANDLNLDGSAYEIASYTNPQHGTLSVDPDGGFTYTPNFHFVGTDTFTYTVTNGDAVSTKSGVAIDVTNAVPVAVDEEMLNTPWWMRASDADGDPVTFKIIDQPKHGTVTFDADTGRYEYQPGPDFMGIDRFRYVANDGLEDSLPAEEVIDWIAPVYEDGEARTDRVFDLTENTAVSDTADPVFWWTGDYQIVQGAQHGSFQMDFGHDAYFRYEPNENYVGDDSVQVVRTIAGIPNKPFTMLFHVVADGATVDPYWKRVNEVPGFAVSNTAPTTIAGVDAGLIWPDSGTTTIELGAQPQHGSVSLNPDNGFNFVPKKDSATDEPYLGWDYFSYTVHEPWGATLTQWVQLHIGDYAVPNTPTPPQNLNPLQFDNSLKGLWQSYMEAKDRLVTTVKAVNDLGKATKDLATADPDADPDYYEGLQELAVAKLDAVTSDFEAYTRQAQSALKALGEYMSHTWVTTQWDFDVSNAITSLPYSVAGIVPTKAQLNKWKAALIQFQRGADFAIANNTFVVTAATETHNALEKSIQFAGLASLTVTGAKLLAKEGCAAFASFVTKQLVNTAAGVALSYVSQNVLAIAQRYGIPIDPEYLRIGADALQVISLVKAARAERKAAGANCFAAGTVVSTAQGEVPIEQLHVGQRVLTQVGDPSATGEPANSADLDSTNIDPATWRLVTLDMPDATGDYQMQLLKPLSWVQANAALAGSWVDLSLPELQISGEAKVLSVGDCPTIEQGPGRVLLGTFQHVSHDLVDVKLADDETPLRVTSGHKLWSLDRGGWVEAGNLQPGERLATETGAAVVQSVSVEAGATEVYNLDVEVDHRYFVGAYEVLAHNADECAPSTVEAAKQQAQLASEELLASAKNGGPGSLLMGAGTGKPLYPTTVNGLVSQYGGSPGDWAKMGGPNKQVWWPRTRKIECHWYENVTTGERVEFKIKIEGHG